jgi:hypothetical protein
MASDLGPKFLGVFPRILDELSNSVKRNSALFEVQFKNIKAMIPIASNGDRRTLELSMQQLIDIRLSKAKTFIEVQRLCETGHNNNGLTLDHETFQKIPAEKHLKFVLIGCFARISDELTRYTVEALSKATAKNDQEYLHFNLRNHLNQSQRQHLHSMKGFTDSVNADLKRFAEIPADYQQCLNSASRQVTAANRDAARWNCWQRMLPDSDLACLATMDQMEQQSSKDFAWQCAKRPETTVGRCLALAGRIPSEFEQMHDDLIWNCYSTLLERMNLEKASCLMLQRSMRIRGHRIKMQWNCMNRLPK